MALSRIANDLEHIGDLIATGLVTSARKRLDEGVVISPETAHGLAELHGAVMVALDGVLAALDEQDGAAAGGTGAAVYQGPNTLRYATAGVWTSKTCGCRRGTGRAATGGGHVGDPGDFR